MRPSAENPLGRSDWFKVLTAAGRAARKQQRAEDRVADFRAPYVCGQTVWEVHAKPPYAPKHFVVAKNFVADNGLLTPGPGWGYLSLTQARKVLPIGAAREGRTPKDPPHVLERWR